MAIEVHVETVVLPGGRIELNVPGLMAGQQATVTITIKDQQVEKKQSILDFLEQLPGHRIFQNADEVDAYIREERDSWED